MVPVRLTLQNFLSYGDACPPIEFDGIHVACLCGSNGNGKSALLDAITWALWGQARSNTADDLIRLGQESMLVDLEFTLDGQHFRVTRKRSHGRTIQSDLQFQVRAEEGEWRALTGHGMRGTQAEINQRLRMDYETFINSAFILQGRADEFSRKTPGERKKILGEILSLGVYDQLSDAAKVRFTDARARVTSLEGQIRDMEQSAAELPQLRTLLAQVTTAHLKDQVGASERREKLQEARVEKARLDTRRKERDDLVRRITQTEGVLATQRGQAAACQARVEGWGKLLQRAAEIRARDQEYHAVSRERDELNARLQELRRLEEARNLLLRRYQEERYRVESQAQLARQKVVDLKTRAESLPALLKELAELEKRIEALDRLREERAALNQRLQELSAGLAEARAEQDRFQADFAKADDVFQRLKDATTGTCPVCQGELPDEKRKELGRQYKAIITDLKEAQGAAIRKEGETRKADAETRRLLAEVEKNLHAGQALRGRVGQVREQHGHAQQAAEQLPELAKSVEAAEALLKQEAFAPETRDALAQAEKDIKALGFDPAREKQIAARLGELSTAPRDLHQLEQAEQALPEDRKLLETLAGSLRELGETLHADQVRRAEADRDLVRAAAVDAEEKKLAGEAAEAEHRERASAEALGAAREGIAQRESLGSVIAGHKTDREAAARDQACYEELTKAFGRNGIQALIIENALPEIENEANLLLSRMSNGQFNVRLLTQKSLKSGGAAETLDIKIDDGGAERPYELYSGGEAFRINFALRIALSKLLARRAGARLETLVIDEGFGSQDQEGRQRLIEAIQTVQDDFARVLVITHLEDLKDAFPTRIEVTKGENGSQVAIY